jgi:hypothetical protein
MTAPPPSSNDRNGSVKDRAGEAAHTGAKAAGDVANTAADKAKDVAQETKKQASDLIGQAREQVQQQASTQQRAVVDTLRSLADELAGMTDRNAQSGMATELVSQANDRVRLAADWLDGRQPGELLDELRSLATRRPTAFLIGAGLAGVLAGRLTRAVVAVHSDDDPSPQVTGTDPAVPGLDPGVPRFPDSTTGADAAGYHTKVIGYSSPGDDTEQANGTQPGAFGGSGVAP